MTRILSLATWRNYWLSLRKRISNTLLLASYLQQSLALSWLVSIQWSGRCSMLSWSTRIQEKKNWKLARMFAWLWSSWRSSLLCSWLRATFRSFSLVRLPTVSDPSIESLIWKQFSDRRVRGLTLPTLISSTGEFCSWITQSKTNWGIIWANLRKVCPWLWPVFYWASFMAGILRLRPCLARF